MRPSEQHSLVMSDLKPDPDGNFVWIRKVISKATRGREAKEVWCTVPYNDKPNTTDYGSLLVSFNCSFSYLVTNDVI